MEYKELRNILYAAAAEHKTVEAFVTFTPDSFPGKEYSKEERTYLFTSNNKAFFPAAGGYSIFGDCMDGKDLCIRLERYMRGEKGGADGWKIENCGVVKYQLVYVYERDLCVLGYYDTEKDAHEAMRKDMAETAECELEELDALLEEGDIEGECEKTSAWLNEHGNSDWTIVPIYMDGAGVVEFEEGETDA